MADKLTRFLTGVGQGITNPKGNLGDFRHASRLYVDNAMARSPRTKFMYHVHFNMNKPAITSPVFKEKYGNQVGLLVRGADLPKITLEHDVKNQYNRKRVVYKELKYEPLNISFHDDSIGIVNAMWAQYLGFYSGERYNPPSAFDNGLYGPYHPTSANSTKYQYGLDVSGKGSALAGGAPEYINPFFNSITIYTLSKKRFNSYILIRPHIISWNSGNVDQNASNGTIEAQMSIAYESVLYGTGKIIKGKEPTGFADAIYDHTPSPMTLGGGTITSVFGQGGLLSELGIGADTALSDANRIFGDYTTQDDLGGKIDGLSAAIKAVNFYKSIRSINKDTLAAEAANLLLTPNATQNAVSGLSNVKFGLANTNTGTKATGK